VPETRRMKNKTIEVKNRYQANRRIKYLVITGEVSMQLFLDLLRSRT
jgi:hypothetical protein